MSKIFWGPRWPRFALAALLGLVGCLVVTASGPGVAAQEPPAGLGPGSAAVVVDEALLRTVPDFAATVLTPLAPGTPVDVVGGPITDPGGTRWYLVAAVGQTGYLPTGALAPMAAAPVAEGEAVAPAEPDPVPVDVAAESEADAAPADEAPTETVADLATVDPATIPVEPAAAPEDEEAAAAATAAPTATAIATDLLNLRAGPSFEAEVLRVLPPGAPATVTGGAESGFVPVDYDGTAGWVDAAYLDASGAPADPAVPAEADALSLGPDATATDTAIAITTEPLNLRTDPAEDAPVVVVMPAGASLVTTGEPVGGFTPVRFGDQTGWANAAFLSIDGTPAAGDAAGEADANGEAEVGDGGVADAEDPLPEMAPGAAGGAGIVWPFAGGTWQVIQGYNNGTHTYRGATADYRYSLDWARADGNTAGQPIYAPVSGTIRWTSKGGMLIDAGNGYGVALFHVTFDGFSSGQSVQQGQPLGVISGPGGPGYAGTPHVDLTLWQLGDGANVSTPFAGANAIAGQEFPDAGAGNQHMGATVSP